ncbi:MAG: hypothetical protein ACLSFA_19670 [Roseburia inulinivorans]
MVDNAELSADCYTATEGSIIITLKPEYLSTLAAGTHSISIVSANGVATADFEVQTADTTAVSPKTGDNDQADFVDHTSPSFLWSIDRSWNQKKVR